MALLAIAIAVVALNTGCKNHLAFGTSTKFGLDISQKPDQTVEVTMGYRRAEMVSIPVAPDGAPCPHCVKCCSNEKQTCTHAACCSDPHVGARKPRIDDADGTNDAYSVIGRFNVHYNPGLFGRTNGLHLKQFFATGMAARKAAQNTNMQRAFGEAAHQVKTKKSQ